MNAAITFTRPISQRGQVVIPRDIRYLLGLNNEVVFTVSAGRVEIQSGQEGFLDDFLDTPRVRGKSPSPAALKEMMSPLRNESLH